MPNISKQPSVMNHNFSHIPQADIPRSTFKRDHGHKTTFDVGKLVPIFVDEALPGDTFNLRMNGGGRLATPLFPLMDNLHLETFFFAVPNRLLWENWQKFNGEQLNPGDSTDYVIPKDTPPAGGYQEGSFYDYIGVPTNVDNIEVNSLYRRAYHLIWDEWFRDENLQTNYRPITGDFGYTNDRALYRRGKRHDYFTSCLPWPQKGESVDVPLGTQAPITTTAQEGEGLLINSAVGNKPIGTSGSKAVVSILEPGSGDYPLYADLSSATAATINQLREAFQIQKLFERDARGGTRYTEIIRSHFGVTSPDSRLQRPEYLGGGYAPIVINPVAQTSETSTNSPQGNLAGIGTVAVDGHGFAKSFTEHCIIIGLVCVRADLSYQQGLNRMFSRETRWDYYWPALAHIGEQAVLNKEIYAQGNAQDEEVFGYQERYAEYRYKPSIVTGKFRSNANGSLDAWHLSQDFAALPGLNAAFIQENPPIERVLAVPDEPHVIFNSFFQFNCARPMPTYGVPGMIDHF